MRRYSDQAIYEAARKHGDQTAAALALGISTSWLSKRTRRYAAANGLAVPRNRNGGQPVVVRRAPPPDTFDHRRVADGGTRVREQRRAQTVVERLPHACESEGPAAMDRCILFGCRIKNVTPAQNRSWPPA